MKTHDSRAMERERRKNEAKNKEIVEKIVEKIISSDFFLFVVFQKDESVHTQKSKSEIVSEYFRVLDSFQ